MDNFKVGDEVEIIQTEGCHIGQKGDFGIVTEVYERSHDVLVKAILTSGKDKAKLSTRCSYRYKCVRRDWDE